MRNTLPWLFSLCLLASPAANALGFDVIEQPAAVGLSFDVIENAEQLPAALDFAVLDCSKCDCEVTGVCVCDKCTCPGCPKRVAKPDNRPLITVTTMDGCAPCKKLEAATKTEALAAFRFVFVERQRVEGGAPRIEWQGIDSRYVLNGWKDAAYFKSVFNRSQKPVLSARGATYFPNGFGVRSNCSGGVCRTCR